MIKMTLMKKSQKQNKPNKFPKIMGSLAFVMGLFLVTTTGVVAAEKAEYDDVIINEYKLGFFEQIALEGHIDRDIPDGNYWFELETGMWGPVGGTANGRIVVPVDYREYVVSRLFKQGKATFKQGKGTQVQLSASVELSTAQDNPDTLKPVLFKPIKATQVEMSATNNNWDHVKPRLFKPDRTAKVDWSAATEECDRSCLKDFIYILVAALSPKV